MEAVISVFAVASSTLLLEVVIRRGYRRRAGVVDDADGGDGNRRRRRSNAMAPAPVKIYPLVQINRLRNKYRMPPLGKDVSTEDLWQTALVMVRAKMAGRVAKRPCEYTYVCRTICATPKNVFLSLLDTCLVLLGEHQWLQQAYKG